MLNSAPMRPSRRDRSFLPATVPGRGEGKAFRPKLVPDALGLKCENVSRLASVSVKSVRYDDAIPEPVCVRLEEIVITVNMVAKFFDGDVDKTVTWFTARNPLLGDVSPTSLRASHTYRRELAGVFHPRRCPTVVLLVGCSKRSQKRDLERAKALAA